MDPFNNVLTAKVFEGSSTDCNKATSNKEQKGQRNVKKKSIHMKSSKRTSNGCLTCKLRKKRCDEVKPVCGDCLRLGRRCEYISDDMTEEEIHKLREEMSLIEADSKTRKRKKKVKEEGPNPLSATKYENTSNGTDDIGLCSSTKKHIKAKKKPRVKKARNGKVVFNPFAMNLASITHSPVFNGLQSSALLPKHITSSPSFTNITELPDTVTKLNFNESNILLSSKTVSTSKVEKSFEGLNTLTNGNAASDIPNSTNSTGNSNNPYTHNDQPKNLSGLSPNFLANIAAVTPIPEIPTLEQNSPAPLLSLNDDFELGLSEMFPANFSKLIHEHFKKEINGKLSNQLDTDTSSKELDSPTPLSTIQDVLSFSPRFQQIDVLDEDFNPDNGKHPNIKSSSKEILVDQSIGYYHDGHHRSTTEPPQLYTNPSIVTNTTLANLSTMGQTLYQYYRDKLSFIVCSAPKTENMYLNTFLPMAHVDKSVLYGLLAWSAFHLGGRTMERQGNYYIKLAIDEFYRRPIIGREVAGNLKLVYDEVDETDETIIKECITDIDAESYQDLQLSQLSRDDLINTRLAAFLILCGVEICKGDVSNWSKFLIYGAELIKMKGGLEKFNESKDEHFLATNYAYHDITAIQVVDDRTIRFDIQEYEKMWLKSNELGFTDPQHGISSPVFKILAEVNKLVLDVQKSNKRLKKQDIQRIGKDDKTKYKSVSESPDELRHGLDEEDCWVSETGSSISSNIEEYFLSEQLSTVDTEDSMGERYDQILYMEELNTIMKECSNIEQKINEAKPKLSPYLTNKELELQLTMFECFQVTSKIHLKQSVQRMNSSSIEIQYLNSQLIKLLDVLLGSEVEACLCLPMFIAGMNVVTQSDRVGMIRRFDSFINRYKWKNVTRCKIVIRYIWKLNNNGDRFIDWYSVVKRLGWDLSFA